MAGAWGGVGGGVAKEAGVGIEAPELGFDGIARRSYGVASAAGMAGEERGDGRGGGGRAEEAGGSACGGEESPESHFPARLRL